MSTKRNTRKKNDDRSSSAPKNSSALTVQQIKPEERTNVEYFVKQPLGNARRARGLVVTGYASGHSTDNFDVSNNEFIDGYELLGLNDEEITAALEAHPNFAMRLKDFKNEFGEKAFDKKYGPEEYKNFKKDLLPKINASLPGQNSRCSKLMQIRETGIIEAKTLEAIDVNNDSWIEAAEFALAGVNIRKEYNNVSTMAKLKIELEKTKTKKVNIQKFFDKFAIDSSRLNDSEKETGNLYPEDKLKL